MDKWQRRTAYYLLMLTGVMLVYAVIYDHGMSAYESEPETFLHSLQVVVETFTTTGFGSDAPWHTPEMNLLIIIMDTTGVFLIFLALPVLVFPAMEELLSTTVPTSVSESLTDHVLVCTYTARADALIDELDAWGVDSVILEPDRDTAVQLHEAGYDVINADPESTEGLEDAGIVRARALVADVSDEVDASIVLAAGEVGDEDLQVVSVVEDPESVSYHRLAGADEVLSPRPLLGRGLASKVTTGISTELGDAIEIGDDFDIAELPIHRTSELVGKTLSDSGIRERAGVNVIGAWFSGEFRSPPDPDAELDNGTVLLVTGREDQLQALKELTLSRVREFRRGETIVVGYGQVGSAVAEQLDEAGVPYRVIDREQKPGVDVVGDALDPDVLHAAELGDARTVVLALPDDTTTEFATLVIRDESPETEVVARVTESESVQKMYRAGADYVLSLASVSGRMIASTILEDEEVLSIDQQVDVIRTEATLLVGQTLEEAQVRKRTGCTVVGVERDGEVITDVGPSFRIERGDQLIVAGTDQGTNRFRELCC
ncbi:TrkA family potassium uptake protein [Haloarchaeobius sp. FL176]|uniref:potassium channel family protein n=1 Tax=Haloarchaeobius sp. FL176 TaxID=2967129 RepID=UPI002147B41B|nr:NAD-binding protein [Haloarchaeobius sp. FL176]